MACELHLDATSAPLYFAMQDNDHEPDDLGVEDWIIDDENPDAYEDAAAQNSPEYKIEEGYPHSLLWRS